MQHTTKQRQRDRIIGKWLIAPLVALLCLLTWTTFSNAQTPLSPADADRLKAVATRAIDAYEDERDKRQAAEALTVKQDVELKAQARLIALQQQEQAVSDRINAKLQQEADRERAGREAAQREADQRKANEEKLAGEATKAYAELAKQKQKTKRAFKVGAVIGASVVGAAKLLLGGGLF